MQQLSAGLSEFQREQLWSCFALVSQGLLPALLSHHIYFNEAFQWTASPSLAGVEYLSPSP